MTDLAHETKGRVCRWTGITVHAGIGETKTLAKVTNELPREHGGALSLVDHAERERLMASVDVADVWGIGPEYATKQREHGATAALELSRVQAAWVQRHLAVIGKRLVRELQGTPCLPLETV